MVNLALDSLGANRARSHVDRFVVSGNGRDAVVDLRHRIEQSNASPRCNHFSCVSKRRMADVPGQRIALRSSRSFLGAGCKLLASPAVFWTAVAGQTVVRTMRALFYGQLDGPLKKHQITD